MTPVLTPLTRASKVLRALRNVCSYFYLKEPRRKRDVPDVWELIMSSVSVMQSTNPGSFVTDAVSFPMDC